LSDTILNVGAVQLARGILIISNGDVDKVLEIFDSTFYGDPRDLLVTANEMSKSSHYGLNEFLVPSKIAFEKEDGLAVSKEKIPFPKLAAAIEIWIHTEDEKQFGFNKKQLEAFEQFLLIDATEIERVYTNLRKYGQELLEGERITKRSFSGKKTLELDFCSLILPKQNETKDHYLLILANTFWKIKGSKYFLEIEILFKNNAFCFLQEYSGLWTRLEWDIYYNAAESNA